MSERRNFLRGVWLLAGGILLCACAGNQAEAEKKNIATDAESGQRACFQRGQVSGFKTLDRTNLIVYAPTKSSAYHVRISPPASELRFANAIAFDSGGSRICGHPGEGVIFDSGSVARKYFVTDVYRLDTEAVQNLIVEFGGDVNVEPRNTLEAEIERDIEQADE
jgi:hypothetical protein